MIIPVIRAGGAADLAPIAAIQAASPEAAQWEVSGYLQYDLRVAICEKQVVGFLVSRAPDGSECEILNLAVSPQFRRAGIGRLLVESLLAGFSGTVFLEVRASNRVATGLYKSIGFEEVSRRPNYYDSPLEAAIVMKFHSC
ncbi:MAG TPA: ribosomal protein S18-alanine N-acetyltransferase [Bryobacteraceae bacterium]|nr:ribosomal protein S18-alanine N-acetyltransferase [Bryobacteraceae bacterium]